MDRPTPNPYETSPTPDPYEAPATHGPLRPQPLAPHLIARHPGVSPSSAEAARLDEHAASLAALAVRSVHPAGGFGWLGPDNVLAVERGIPTWVHCRMTHVLACEVLRGAEAYRPLLDVGADALLSRTLRDERHDGWYAGVGGSRPHAAGLAPGASDKAAYAHAFVLLAAASLTAAGHRRGRTLLAQALAVYDRYFWEESAGMPRESWDAGWTTPEPYRGVNATMHSVEAMLAVGDVTGEERYTRRALRMLRRVIREFARNADWRLPEHYDTSWRVLPDFHKDRPADPFRPYGVTIGHVLEWSRLAICGARAAQRLDGSAPEWLVQDAAALFEAGMRRGWAVDGAPGIVYTTDFTDIPVVRERMHWVVCEAIAAAWTLYEVTGDPSYAATYEHLSSYAREFLLDEEHGGWHHELSPRNAPSATIWWGKPDVYHAYQCALVPLLPGMVSFAGALRDRSAPSGGSVSP